ncbi:MAG: hypothetical protein J6A01_02790, partial [Proteobacteria bacterium]|nr:hypothetical protein [Pseudomonadota bacterium]
DGMECGDDGCGGACGTCDAGFACKKGLCVEAECVPNCNGKQCGGDGCGGNCGTCGNDKTCDHGRCRSKDGSMDAMITIEANACSSTPNRTQNFNFMIWLMAALGALALRRSRRQNH